MPNPQVYSITDLTRQIKGLIEPRFQEVGLRGEISNFRRQPSGHLYFSLKDAGATIPAVCFRNDAARMGIDVRNGMQIVGFGRISLYEPHGRYQIILREIMEDGIGRLQAAFLRLREKLQSEGLFDSARKKPLPQLPKTIGFVTSPSGAALRDFIAILERRQWNGRLIVIPARVQGTEAAGEIVRGIQLANRHALCELLVVGRGGGSLEDLWPFNEEIVARAVAESSIPTISAVGHEIDFTLSDFAADHRAETPSAAAEWITSSWHKYLIAKAHLQKRLLKATAVQLTSAQQRLALSKAHLRNSHPRNRLDQAALRLDDLQGRLNNTLSQTIKESSFRLQTITTRFHALQPEKQLRFYRENLRQISRRLLNNSHQATLKRGYAIIRDAEGNRIIQDGQSLAAGQDFIVEMKDGPFLATRSADKK
jgi:exodeoxyribonuclease VII large subunit